MTGRRFAVVAGVAVLVGAVLLALAGPLLLDD